MKYIFGSVRGDDFEIEVPDGTLPVNAFLELCDRESANGTMWRLNDPYYNRAICRTQGFTRLDGDKDGRFHGPVYKVGTKNG